MKFDWGADVQISSAAPGDYRPGATGYIVGYRVKASPPAAPGDAEKRVPMYLFEYEDGSSKEIEEEFIEPR